MQSADSEVEAKEIGDVQEPKEDRKINDVDFIPKDTGWAWMCCLGCFIQYAVTVGGMIRCFGIFFVAFMDEFDSNAGTTAWLGVLSSCLGFATSAIPNAALRYGSRPVVFSGGLVTCFGYITSMFATRVEHLYVTYGLLLGMGYSLTISVSVAHLRQYFELRKALAFGIATSGVGVGAFVFPVIMTLCMEEYGLRGALLIMGGLSLNLCIAGALLRPASAYRPKRRNEGSTENLNLCRNIYKTFALIDWSLLKNRRFLLVCAVFSLYYAAYPIFYNIIPAYGRDIGFSSTWAASLLSIMGVAQIAGRPVCGLLADTHILKTNTFIGIGTFLTSFFCGITAFITNYVAIGFTGFMYAFCTSPMFVLQPLLLSELFGPEKLNSCMGINGLFMAVGLLFSTTIGGVLKDTTGDWKASFWYPSAIMFVVGVITLLLTTSPKSDKRKDNETDNRDKI